MLTIEMFREKLASVKDATSVKGQQYTDIKLEDTVITFQRNKNKRECIAISELYDIYLNEATINTTIVKKYLSQRTHSPAYAILRAANLYNSKGERIELKSKEENTSNYDNSTFLKPGARRLLVIIHAIPIVAVLLAILFLSAEPCPLTFANIMISLVIIIVSASFFIYVLKLKKDNIREITYTSYFTLLIFTIGIFPFYNYIKDYQSRNKVRMEYTVGLRSWGSSAEYSNIKVSYFDRFGNPYTLDNSVIIDSKNWIQNTWQDDYLEDFSPPNTKFILQSDSNCFKIVLINCGAVLKPSVFKEIPAGFFISADINLLCVESFYLSLDSAENFQSTQLCLNVPVVPASKSLRSLIKKLRSFFKKDSIKYNIGNHYYAYEHFYNNFSDSKLRIPGFNFDYLHETLSKKVENDINRHASLDIIHQINERFLNDYTTKNRSTVIPDSTKISLSALLFENNAAFYIIDPKDNYSLPLFNFNVEKYGAFKLRSHN